MSDPVSIAASVIISRPEVIMSSPQPTAIDPVCGMTVPVGVITREYEGSTYHFCSALCASRFEQDAIAYVTVARLGLDGWGETQAPGFLVRGQD